MGIKANSAAGRAVLKALGGKPKGGRPPPDVSAAKLAASWEVVLHLPVRVLSESNRREHWRVRRRRGEVQRGTLGAVVREAGLTLWLADERPVSLAITLTHVGPEMDDDNLRSAFKGLRDELARLLEVPNDRDPSVSWHYQQRHGPGTGVVVSVRPGGTT